MILFQKVLNIPFMRILFSVFSCKNDFTEIYSEIKCKSGFHYFFIFISVILIIIYKIITLIFNTTLYEFGFESDKLITGYSSSAIVLLDIIELILIISYQFISYRMTLSLISLFISLFISLLILIHFLVIHPFSNEFAIKFYLSLNALFCWTCILCTISIFLDDSEFKSGIILLFIGSLFILIIIFITNFDFSIEKIFCFLF